MKEFTIYGRPGCGFCSAAVQLCQAKNFDYKYIDIWKEGISKQELEKTVGKPVLTVPQVFCGETHIGGFDDLKAYVDSME